MTFVPGNDIASNSGAPRLTNRDHAHAVQLTDPSRFQGPYYDGGAPLDELNAL
jgi:hypothetical protein